MQGQLYRLGYIEKWRQVVIAVFSCHYTIYIVIDFSASAYFVYIFLEKESATLFWKIIYICIAMHWINLELFIA